MKFLITENKLEQIVFKYLNNQDFIKIERENKIYFLNHEGDEFEQIRYDKGDGYCFIDYNLNREISSFFSLEKFETKILIGRWVEDSLQMRASEIRRKNRRRPGVVDDNLHFKVSDISLTLRITIE